MPTGMPNKLSETTWLLERKAYIESDPKGYLQGIKNILLENDPNQVATLLPNLNYDLRVIYIKWISDYSKYKIRTLQERIKLFREVLILQPVRNPMYLIHYETMLEELKQCLEKRRRELKRIDKEI